MPKGVRSRTLFNKRRLYARDYINKKSIIFCISVLLISVSSAVIISNILLINKANKYTKKYSAKKEEKNSVSIYTAENEDDGILDEQVINTTSNVEDNKDELEDKIIQSDNNYNDDNTGDNANLKQQDLSKINLTLLGEIMMGGKVTKNVNYIYSSAFKNIHLYTKEADFTYSVLGTNITNAEKVDDAKNKYIVTKDIINGICGIGIDAMSIATDHMIDYPKNIFSTTKATLEKNDILVILLSVLDCSFSSNNIFLSTFVFSLNDSFIFISIE